MDSILNILSYVLWVVIALGILVFVHELGHFLAAKQFKMRVDKFSIGFPPKLYSKKLGETIYQIGATPLGGYVKIAGMIDESMDTSFAGSEIQPWEFRAKPVWQRLIVMTAGVVFNLLLAAVIFIGLRYAYGEDLIPADRIERVYIHEGSLAHEIGLRTGDRIVAVNGEDIVYYQDILSIEAVTADEMTITVVRDGLRTTYTAPTDIAGRLNKVEGNLGIDAFPSLIGGIADDMPAGNAGMRVGDRITSIDGKPVHFWTELTFTIGESISDTLLVGWERMEGSRTVSFLERMSPVEQNGRKMIGISSPTTDQLYEEFGVFHKDYSFASSLALGVRDVWANTRGTAELLRRIATGRENVRESLGGPVLIAKYTKEAAERGAQDFWYIVAMLSITLAIFNILPIPALDGGHVVFLLYEGITRREPSLRFRMVLQQIGMFLLLGFMVFVIMNDILRF